MTLHRPRALGATLVLGAILLLPNATFAARWGGHHGPLGGRRHQRHGLVTHQGIQRQGTIKRRAISGTVVSLSGVSAPATLSVQTSANVTVTVVVSSTTALVRRYDGHSSLDEFSPGDHVSINGHFESGSTTVFDATRIKDNSIQKAYTRVNGQVQSLANGVATLNIGRKHNLISPYHRGQSVQVSFAANVIVMSGSVTQTVAAVQPGVRVMVMGLYNRQTHLLVAGRVRLLGNHGNPQPQPTATSVPDTATATPTTVPSATATLTATATTVVTPTATMTNTVAPTATMTATVAPTNTP